MQTDDRARNTFNKSTAFYEEEQQNNFLFLLFQIKTTHDANLININLIHNRTRKQNREAY